MREVRKDGPDLVNGFPSTGIPIKSTECFLPSIFLTGHSDEMEDSDSAFQGNQSPGGRCTEASTNPANQTDANRYSEGRTLHVTKNQNGINAALPTVTTHTDGLSPQPEFSPSSSQVGGVGISFEGARLGHGIVILKIAPSGPAEKGGLVVGDEIVSVDYVPVESKTKSEVREMLLGPAGSTVVVQFKRSTLSGVFDLERQLMREVVPVEHDSPIKALEKEVEHWQGRCKALEGEMAKVALERAESAESIPGNREFSQPGAILETVRECPSREESFDTPRQTDSHSAWSKRRLCRIALAEWRNVVDQTIFNGAKATVAGEIQKNSQLLQRQHMLEEEGEALKRKNEELQSQQGAAADCIRKMHQECRRLLPVQEENKRLQDQLDALSRQMSVLQEQLHSERVQAEERNVLIQDQKKVILGQRDALQALKSEAALHGVIIPPPSSTSSTAMKTSPLPSSPSQAPINPPHRGRGTPRSRCT